MLTPEDVLAHPRFLRARDTHIAALTALFAGNRFVTWMMADAAVICLRGLIIGCHASYAPDDRSTWATPANLRRPIVAAKLASPRRIDTMIARFRQARFVEGRVTPADRRVHLLAPTPQLLAHDRNHLAAYHRFLSELLPGQGYEWIRTDGQETCLTETRLTETHLAVRRAAYRRLPAAFAFRRHAPIMMFLARDAGYLAFLLLAHAQLAGREHAVSFTGMASDLGVSRTHVRNLFREAEAAGYVRLNATGTRPVEITPPLWTSYDRFLADVQVGQHAIAQAAFGREV